jgi:hypothetical protein
VFSPEQITATMLGKLRDVASAALSTKVVDCVVSVSNHSVLSQFYFHLYGYIYIYTSYLNHLLTKGTQLLYRYREASSAGRWPGGGSKHSCSD